MPNRQRGGTTRAWTRTREAVLLRDRYICQIAIAGEWRTKEGKKRRCLVRADCAHHIHGWSRCAGCKQDLLSHLQAACTPCNLKVGEPKQPKVKGRSSTKWF